LGYNSKAKKILGWEPKVGFDELVKMMVESDIKMVEKGLVM
jgi:GDPmannose 4,6-dehydratase